MSKVKVEFLNTTVDTKEQKTYRAGTVTEIDESFAANCEKLGAIRYVVSDVIEKQIKEMEEKIAAAKEEERKKQDEIEKEIEQSLVEQEEEFNLIEYVKGLKLAELKDFAKTNNVNLKGKTKKADILEIILTEIHKG